MTYRKLVRLDEVKNYLIYGWRISVKVGPPPKDYKVGMVKIEYHVDDMGGGSRYE